VDKVSTVSPEPSSGLRLLVEKESGQRVLRCYQCGKCSAGCPVAYAMDLGPRHIMRALQLGLEDEALHSSAIWLCLFCQTCSARCPNKIDIALVMETLRHLALREGRRPAEKDIQLFHRIFLGLVQRLGRVHELGLGALYNLLSRHPLANVTLLPRMVAKGKLSLFPKRAKGAAEVAKLFAKVRELEKTSPLGKEQ